MNEIKQLKEKQINDYISNLILEEESIDVDKMKNDLSIILGEKPGIELEYKSENMILEDGKEKIRKEKLETVNVYFSYIDENNDLRFSTLTYLAD